MDPDTNVCEQLSLARRIIVQIDSEKPVDKDEANYLAELVLALDEWIRNGGFLPARWMHNDPEGN